MQQIEADVRSLQIAAVMVGALGGKPEWPSVESRLEELDKHLASEPKHIDAEEQALRDALGLRRPGA